MHNPCSFAEKMFGDCAMGLDRRQHAGAGKRPADGGPMATEAKVYVAAVASGIGWTWAVTLLAARQHLTGNYDVLSAGPPLWGNIGLSTPFLAVALAIGLIAAISSGHAVRSAGRFWAPTVRWLMCSWLIPGLDLLRLSGVAIPATFLEPLWLAAITGAAAGTAADVFVASAARKETDGSSLARKLEHFPWIVLVWLLAILCCGWWYYEGQQAYSNYLLGYNDFGHFGWRVANTWEGRGFLLETPSLPAFWDHFNPGLALLAPLWAIWPDPRLFLLIQAICLAAPAPLVHGIARRLGASPAAAAVWGAAYLTFPAVGQLNLNYSYGWHPVSVALPLLFLAIWAVLCRWRTVAFAAAILAGSFQEDIMAVLCCLALSLAFQAWMGRRRTSLSSSDSCRLPADVLPAWAWLGAAAIFATAFVVVFQVAAFSKFQSSRFPDLGSSTREILLSPILRPTVFWHAILRPRCGYFLLCLMVPLGLRSLLRGWPMLLATALPFGVLLAWIHPPATSIAFQYTTALIPVLFLAAMVGCVAADDKERCNRRGPGTSPDETGAGRTMFSQKPAASSSPLWHAAVTALVAGATASVAFGSLPWSSQTLTDAIAKTYRDSNIAENRAVGSPGNAMLNDIVAKVRRPGSAVLATGRIAAHLLAVGRLDTVGQMCSRWKAFEKETGRGRSPIELFDWVVLDAKERFYQSPEELRFVINAAKRAGYRLVESGHGILVYSRPSLAGSWHENHTRSE
jgi:uncharacterized membrane protein